MERMEEYRRLLIYSKQMQRMAEKVFDILRLKTYAKIDFIMNEKNELFCLEANTLPCMTPMSLLPWKQKHSV
jgi:D-alanine-D-alanine ligase